MDIDIRSDEEGLSPLDILKRRLPDAPAGYLRQLLRAGKVRRGSASIDEQSLLAQGERLRLPRSGRLLEIISEPALREPEILYESREILALFKPAGLAVHRGVGHEDDNLLARVDAMMKRRGAPFRTSPVHRLDVETSGPILFAKGRHGAGELGKAFMNGAAEKIYRGLAYGSLADAGELTTPVFAKGKLKPALTEFTPLEARNDFTLLEMRLRSGRTHQIRRQLADLGHPLAGDGRYRGPQPPGLTRLFLHCTRLSLVNPFDGRLLNLESPLPPELEKVLLTLGFAIPPGTDSTP